MSRSPSRASWPSHSATRCQNVSIWAQTKPLRQSETRFWRMPQSIFGVFRGQRRLPNFPEPPCHRGLKSIIKKWSIIKPGPHLITMICRAKTWFYDTSAPFCSWTNEKVKKIDLDPRWHPLTCSWPDICFVQKREFAYTNTWYSELIACQG